MSTKKPEDENKVPETGAAPEAATPEQNPPVCEQADLTQAAEGSESAANEAEKALAELGDRYLRLAAEYENYRRRTNQERESLYASIRGDAVATFFPVYDNLERAVKQACSDESYAQGVAMIFKQLQELMEKLGVCEIPAEPGGSFDPALHDAVMHVEDGALGQGVIAEVFQKGFICGEKVLRHSVVKVAN